MSLFLLQSYPTKINATHDTNNTPTVGEYTWDRFTTIDKGQQQQEHHGLECQLDHVTLQQGHPTNVAVAVVVLSHKKPNEHDKNNTHETHLLENFSLLGMMNMKCTTI